jgi:hypothetical protein
MSENEASIFDELRDPNAIRRRDMLPGWIRFFCWFFAILSNLGAIVLIIVIFAGDSLTSYFQQQGVPVPYQGSSLWLVMQQWLGVAEALLTGTAAIALLKERSWAVKLAIVDGMITLGRSLYSVFRTQSVVTGNFPFSAMTIGVVCIQLIFLIPYLITLIRIRSKWEENKYAMQPPANYEP